eukprot:3956299-Pleurochrysis_carterae.AAC.2
MARAQAHTTALSPATRLWEHLLHARTIRVIGDCLIMRAQVGTDGWAGSRARCSTGRCSCSSSAAFSSTCAASSASATPSTGRPSAEARGAPRRGDHAH